MVMFDLYREKTVKEVLPARKSLRLQNKEADTTDVQNVPVELKEEVRDWQLINVYDWHILVYISICMIDIHKSIQMCTHAMYAYIHICWYVDVYVCRWHVSWRGLSQCVQWMWRRTAHFLRVCSICGQRCAVILMILSFIFGVLHRSVINWLIVKCMLLYWVLEILYLIQPCFPRSLWSLKGRQQIWKCKCTKQRARLLGGIKAHKQLLRHFHCH